MDSWSDSMIWAMDVQHQPLQKFSTGQVCFSKCTLTKYIHFFLGPPPDTCLPDSCSQGELVYIGDLERGFGLATQEPWIQFTSIRENILFGKEYDARFYQEVVEACALSDDLNVRALQ